MVPGGSTKLRCGRFWCGFCDGSGGSPVLVLVWVAGLVPDGSGDFGAGSRVLPVCTWGPGGLGWVSLGQGWNWLSLGKKPGREVPGFQAFADQDQSSPWVKPVLSKQQMEEAGGSTRDFRIPQVKHGDGKSHVGTWVQKSFKHGWNVDLMDVGFVKNEAPLESYGFIVLLPYSKYAFFGRTRIKISCHFFQAE
jgi:hypothetical protein